MPAHDATTAAVLALVGAIALTGCGGPPATPATSGAPLAASEQAANPTLPSPGLPGEAGGAPPPPPPGFEGQSVSLRSLVAGSDAVVVGVVLETRRGDLEGDTPGYQLQLREYVLQVEEVLAGAVDGAQVVGVETGWGSAGQPLEVDGVPATAPGQRGVWFLTRTQVPSRPDGGVWTVTDISHGRYLLQGNRLMPPNGSSPLAAELAERGLDGLSADVRAQQP